MGVFVKVFDGEAERVIPYGQTHFAFSPLVVTAQEVEEKRLCFFRQQAGRDTVGLRFEKFV